MDRRRRPLFRAGHGSVREETNTAHGIHLETSNLTKIYGQKEAAKDVNLHIREGQIYGLIGRNGAGKTTIMRMISGLSRPTRRLRS